MGLFVSGITSMWRSQPIYVSTMWASTSFSRNFVTVLGIESSCDDTAVAVVNSDRKVLCRRQFTDRNVQSRLGGIAPLVGAQQHRFNLDRLTHECMQEIGCRLGDLDAIAVTSRPGLVLCLKEGIHKALKLARIGRLPLVPVHHMRAHALSAFLVNSQLRFPFVAALLSGGHCQFVWVRSASEFLLLGHSLSGSPGECLDKVGRRLGLHLHAQYQHIHVGAAMEELAKQSSFDGHLRYSVRSPSTTGADTNFSALKSSLLQLITVTEKNESINLEDFAASVQHLVCRHIASKLHATLEHLHNSQQLQQAKHLVLSGGVASNAYICDGLRKIAEHYGLETIKVPPHLCADNAEMIAWAGIQLLEERSADVLPWTGLPDVIYADSRSPIGADCRHQVPKKPKFRLSAHTVHGQIPLKFSSSGSFKAVYHPVFEL